MDGVYNQLDYLQFIVNSNSLKKCLYNLWSALCTRTIWSDCQYMYIDLSYLLAEKLQPQCAVCYLIKMSKKFRQTGIQWSAVFLNMHITFSNQTQW